MQALPGVHDTHTHEHPPDGKIPTRKTCRRAPPSDQNLDVECGGTLVL